MAYYRSYNKETKLAIASVISVFNNIRISRFKKDGSESKVISVPCKYSQESQIIKSIRDKNKVQSLPLITVQRTSMERDIDRVVDMNKPFLFQGKLFSESQINNKSINEQQKEMRRLSYDFRRNPPQPMNIGFKVSFFAQYEEDLWQMENNVLPIISPFVCVSSYHPYDRSQIIRSRITCDGNVEEEVLEEHELEKMSLYKFSLNVVYHGHFWFGNDSEKFSWDTPQSIDRVQAGTDGPVGNTNEGDNPSGSQYVDPATGDIYNGIDTGKNVNLGDEPGENEFVDPETGTIYRKDYHLVGGNLQDGFYITAPNQTCLRVDELIKNANTHEDLPYHENISVDKKLAEENTLIDNNLGFDNVK